MRLTVFEQDNCVWCSRLHPHIKKLADDYNIELEFINITDDWEIAKQHDFRTTPTVMRIENNYVVQTYTLKPESGIAGLISEIKESLNGQHM